MSDFFDLQLGILPAAQRKLWDELQQVPPEFVLYGGTAIALRLGHRESIDFDFFGNQAFDPSALAARIPFLTGSTITEMTPNSLTANVDRGGAVKVSFFAVPNLVRLEPPSVAPDNGLRMASLLDLAGTKAKTVLQRAEAKDYLDIDALMTEGGLDLPTALSAAKALYGETYNPQSTLKALSYFGDGNLDQLPEPVKDRLAKAARETDLDKLPELLIIHDSDRGQDLSR